MCLCLWYLLVYHVLHSGNFTLQWLENVEGRAFLAPETARRKVKGQAGTRQADPCAWTKMSGKQDHEDAGRRARARDARTWGLAARLKMSWQYSLLFYSLFFLCLVLTWDKFHMHEVGHYNYHSDTAGKTIENLLPRIFLASANRNTALPHIQNLKATLKGRPLGVLKSWASSVVQSYSLRQLEVTHGHLAFGADANPKFFFLFKKHNLLNWKISIL